MGILLMALTRRWTSKRFMVVEELLKLIKPPLFWSLSTSWGLCWLSLFAIAICFIVSLPIFGVIWFHQLRCILFNLLFLVMWRRRSSIHRRGVVATSANHGIVESSSLLWFDDGAYSFRVVAAPSPFVVVKLVARVSRLSTSPSLLLNLWITLLNDFWCPFLKACSIVFLPILRPCIRWRLMTIPRWASNLLTHCLSIRQEHTTIVIEPLIITIDKLLINNCNLSITNTECLATSQVLDHRKLIHQY